MTTIDLKKGRLTSEKLIDWINQKFIDLKITDYQVYKIERTRFRSDDYETGACRLYFWFKDITVSEDSLLIHSYFLGFFTLKEYQYYIKNGYKLFLKFENNRFPSISSLQLEVRKVN